MAKIFFCPHCGNKLHLSSDADLVQYKNGVCKYCGFIGDFIDVGLSNDEFFSQIDDYATQKNIDIDATFENMWRTRIEMFNIDQDPRFDWDASLKSMKEKDKELLEADLQFKARQNAKKAAANAPHCPTCESHHTYLLCGLVIYKLLFSVRDSPLYRHLTRRYKGRPVASYS